MPLLEAGDRSARSKARKCTGVDKADRGTPLASEDHNKMNAVQTIIARDERLKELFPVPDAHLGNMFTTPRPFLNSFAQIIPRRIHAVQRCTPPGAANRPMVFALSKGYAGRFVQKESLKDFGMYLEQGQVVMTDTRINAAVERIREEYVQNTLGNTRDQISSSIALLRGDIFLKRDLWITPWEQFMDREHAETAQEGGSYNLRGMVGCCPANACSTGLRWTYVGVDAQVRSALYVEKESFLKRPIKFLHVDVMNREHAEMSTLVKQFGDEMLNGLLTSKRFVVFAQKKLLGYSCFQSAERPSNWRASDAWIELRNHLIQDLTKPKHASLVWQYIKLGRIVNIWTNISQMLPDCVLPIGMPPGNPLMLMLPQTRQDDSEPKQVVGYHFPGFRHFFADQLDPGTTGHFSVLGKFLGCSCAQTQSTSVFDAFPNEKPTAGAITRISKENIFLTQPQLQMGDSWVFDTEKVGHGSTDLYEGNARLSLEVRMVGMAIENEFCELTSPEE